MATRLTNFNGAWINLDRIISVGAGATRTVTGQQDRVIIQFAGSDSLTLNSDSWSDAARLRDEIAAAVNAEWASQEDDE